MNLTKTYVIIDGLFKDTATSSDYNPNWSNLNNRFTVSRDDTGTLLTSTGAWSQWYANNNATFSAPLCVEFEVVSFTETPVIRFRNNNANSPFMISETGHYKIVFDESSIDVIVNGVSKQHWIPVSILELPFAVFFECSDANESVKYRNFVIYPI